MFRGWGGGESDAVIRYREVADQGGAECRDGEKREEEG